LDPDKGEKERTGERTTEVNNNGGH